ncbi:MAG: hypothetical protein HPY68_07180 [Candidatus Atribacteria bacterium]|nr:hypothetical protein [Candidatus Atribacteria bacterium]
MRLRIPNLGHAWFTQSEKTQKQAQHDKNSATRHVYVRGLPIHVFRKDFQSLSPWMCSAGVHDSFDSDSCLKKRGKDEKVTPWIYLGHNSELVSGFGFTILNQETLYAKKSVQKVSFGYTTDAGRTRKEVVD